MSDEGRAIRKTQATERDTTTAGAIFGDDPLWYKDAIIYELHVRAFFDSNADGMGDFQGLTQKLDYLQNLGVTAIWVLPFYPSPWKDDGYDIADYTDVHQAYGKLEDVRQFVQEAHRRGLRVIGELVCNHTSDQHPWFQAARRAPPGSVARDFYVWSDTPEKYKEARIIFKDFEHSNWSWDPVAGAYYWHRFFAHQPDLNFESPHVREAVLKAMDFWLEMGFDGLRLDAIPYLYEQEGTNCENLPETHAFLKELRAHVDSHFQNRMLLAEANQWPEEAVTYFGDGDECHMCFHFPVMPRLFMALRMEDRFPILDILAQTPAIPETAQWAIFLRNHDELTLEMVTDEERDYMYQVYALDRRARINLGIRRRLAPLLRNDRRQIELLNGLLFALPGTPVIYYGDEIGMGDNIYLGDRDGVRTPMQWSPDRNAGFSAANRQKLYLPVIDEHEYHYEVVNVALQEHNPNSLLWWMKRMIALRKRSRAFSRGTLEFLYPDNRKVLAFLRRYEDEVVLVVANLSNTVQYVGLDLAAYQGLVPVEMFGQGVFPRVTDQPYVVMLGAYAFHWFGLEARREVGGWSSGLMPAAEIPEVAIPMWDGTRGIGGLFGSDGRHRLLDILPLYFQARGWFRGQREPVKSFGVIDVIPLAAGPESGALALLAPEGPDGEITRYLLPLAVATSESANQMLVTQPGEILARLRASGGNTTMVLYDAVAQPGVAETLLDLFGGEHQPRGTGGTLRVVATPALQQVVAAGESTLAPSLAKGAQYNSVVLYGDQLVLKLFRRIEPGVNPELELGRFLAVQGFAHVPPLLGALEYHQGGGVEPMTVAVLQRFIPNEGDGWQYTLDALGRFFDRVVALAPTVEDVPFQAQRLLEVAQAEITPQTYEVLGTYVEMARLLGQRSAALHLALASDPTDVNFAPEPFSGFYQRSLYQSMRSLTGQVLLQLRRQVEDEGLSAQREVVGNLLAQEPAILQRFHTLIEGKINAMRIRTHGNYHLGQVLMTGNDVVIIDFEGDPSRSVSERRLKRSPLRDVAGMLWSFQAAPYTALFRQDSGPFVRAEDRERLEQWARCWHFQAAGVFLQAYLETAGQAPFLPPTLAEQAMLLDAYLLQEAIGALGQGISEGVGGLTVPLKTLERLLGTSKP